MNDSIAIVYHGFTILEFLCFVGFLYSQIKAKNVRRSIVFTSNLFVLFVFLFPIFGNGGMLLDSIQIGVETIIILIFSFYFLYEKLNDTTTLFIYNTYQFWIVVGIVIYLSGSFFTYIFASSLSQKEIDKYWVITNIFSILRTIFFSIAILVNSKPSRKFPMSDLDFSSLN